VYNSGSATLTLGAVTVPAGFTLTKGLSGSLAPGASDTFTVRLDNATVGTKSGDISFSTNDADENPFNFRITGTVNAVAANLALGRPAAASTSYSGYPASNATDGNTGSRWSSQFSDSEWIYVDLGSVSTINRIVLRWETAFGRGYKLQVSNDASTWSDVYSTTTGDGGVDDITLATAASGRYVRMLGTQRGTIYGYSLWELEVYGAGETAPEIAVLGNGVSITDGDTTPSPSDHTDFGTIVQAGPTISRTFTVYNSGSATLTLGAVTVPAGFTVTEGLSGSLAPGASDTFTVRLDNATVGTKSGDISFSTNDGDENPFNFRITGTVNAVAANLALGRPAVASTSYSGYPASNATDGNASSRWSSQFSDNEWLYVDLGSVYTINRIVLRWEVAFGRAYKLQVSNDASTWSDVYSTTTGDGGVDDITLSAPASGRYVRMLGTQRGTMYGYSVWEFEVYGGGAAAPEIEVTGNGISIADGDTTPSATDYTDFGTIVQAGPTVSRTFTVYNSGSATLTLGAVTVPAGFTLTEGLSGSLAPGASDTFTVRLDNATVGTKSGDISFNTNDGDENPFNFRITGTVVAATAPEIVVLGNGISIADGDTTPSASDYTDFGTIVQASPTISRTFTVYNSGSATLTLGAVTVPAGFTLTEGLSGSLAPGASDTFTVRLDNATVGTKSGDISFNTNDGDENPFNFRITGIVAAPAAGEIDVTGNGIPIVDGDTTPSAADNTDFGSVPVGNTVVHTFTIINSGSGILRLTGSPTVEVVGGGGSFTVLQPVSVWIAAGTSTDFQIVYTPTAAGLHTATVRIANDDSNENPYEFVIQGTGTQEQTGWLSSPDVPKAIGDLQTVVSTLAVNGLTGPITDVDVQVDITHTWDSDLDVYLISPSGTRVELFTDVGGSGDNFSDTILDDQAGVGIAFGVAPFSGSYRPEGFLSALTGENPNGTWRLEITDDAGGDTGTLNHWALRITAGMVQSQSVPYQQVFAAAKPGAAEGWEYYSTNAGRIEVVAGRLRMDDMIGDTTSSLNEAILHVNLTGRSNVQLVLDHVSLSDENTPLPTSFTGHYNGDGISLSVDGVHWIKVTDLTGSFTGQSFALDSVLQQAQIAAGSTNLSDVRIKFQQFDDYPNPDDGREFDNIQILAV
jgi:subtilisin-like proprotein convertase family protein